MTKKKVTVLPAAPLPLGVRLDDPDLSQDDLAKVSAWLEEKNAEQAQEPQAG